MFVRTAALLAIAAAGADAFMTSAPLARAPSARSVSPAAGNLQMGFFDNIMGNTPVPKEVATQGEVVQGLQPVKGQVLITFLPSGAQVNANPGEKLGDAARRSGLQVPYGCREGVCGTCEARQTQPSGQSVDIRVCTATVPKTNLDAPDREKMWGDLRGGKKSVSELRGTPDTLTVTMANPNIAYKRQQTFEQSKDQLQANKAQWLDPNYKSPPQGGAPPPPQKKGWW